MRKALAALLAVLPLFAQTNSGTILGTVRDSQDAVVVTASVANGVSKSVPVNQAGEYTVPYLIPGEYKVSVEAAGFKRESFNTFNRVQFAKPGLQNGSTAFGVISVQQNQPRKLQVALKVIF